MLLAIAPPNFPPTHELFSHNAKPPSFARSSDRLRFTSASASASGNQFVTYQAFVGFDAHGKVIVQTNANAPLAIPDRCGKFGKLSSAAVGLGAGLVGGSERNSFEGNTAVLTRVQTDSG